MGNKTLILSLILTIVGIVTQSLFGTTVALYQLLFSIVGIGIYILIRNIDLLYIVKLQYIFYAGSIMLLLILFLVADPIRGSRRWFVIGGFNVQPSVLITPFFILVIISYLTHIKEYSIKNFIPLFILTFIPILMIFKQPDLGTALILVATFGVIFFYSGIPVKQLLTLFLIVVPFTMATPFLLKPYQVQRIESFLNPHFDPSGVNYNSLQSVIAIGSGGLLGKGILFASQSKLNFLPEAHTDFIFATYVETFGFVGGLILLVILFSFLFTLMTEVYDAKNRFLQLYTIGVFAYVFMQVSFNIGMNLRLMPVVGVPLPFISYGGTSLLTLFILLGIKDKLKEL